MKSTNVDGRKKILYKRWSQFPKLIGVETPFEEFEKYFNSMDFSCCCSVSKKFFTDRFSSIFSDEQIEEMFLLHKTKVFEKRGSPYDYKNIMKKFSISEEEAKLYVENLKSKTKGTKENFIKRYGEEEGIKKFERFKALSKTSIENYKKRYADSWEEKWDHFMSTRLGSTLPELIKKFGEKEGLERYNRINESRRYKSSKKYYIDRFGDVEGEIRYRELIESKRIGITYYINKFGEEQGKIKYLQTCKERGRYSSKSYFIDKYGLEKGTEIFKDVSKRKSPIYNLLLKEVESLEEADRLYQIYKNNHDLNNSASVILSTKFKVLSKSPISKSSIDFFKDLEIALGRPLLYGKGKELKLFCKDRLKSFRYDCLDEQTKTIIEFHGVAFHPKEGDFKWVNPYGVDYHSAKANDDLKKELAISLGYNYIVVWSDEVSNKFNKNKTINKILNKL